MEQTYEQAVEKTVKWWSQKSFKVSLNQNNGDDSQTGGMAFILMNMLSTQTQGDITEGQIQKFEEKLTEILMNMKEKASYHKSLDVDYHPCIQLCEAADFAGITTMCFPCKTRSYIDEKNKVFAAYQYGGKYLEL